MYTIYYIVLNVGLLLNSIALIFRKMDSGIPFMYVFIRLICCSGLRIRQPNQNNLSHLSNDSRQMLVDARTVPNTVPTPRSMVELDLGVTIRSTKNLSLLIAN